MKVALFYYGTGNLHSLTKAFELAGAGVRLEDDVEAALNADALVLPGVGAFGQAAARLEPHAAALRYALQSGHPCLGVCLGMQLLFERSDEGTGSGLGVLSGRVRKLNAPRLPHMGWNQVQCADNGSLFGIDSMHAYFANSYVAVPADATTIVGWTSYGSERFPAAVRFANTWGVQFHPEKSGAAGIKLLRNFLHTVRT